MAGVKSLIDRFESKRVTPVTQIDTKIRSSSKKQLDSNQNVLDEKTPNSLIFKPHPDLTKYIKRTEEEQMREFSVSENTALLFRELTGIRDRQTKLVKVEKEDIDSSSSMSYNEIEEEMKLSKTSKDTKTSLKFEKDDTKTEFPYATKLENSISSVELNDPRYSRYMRFPIPAYYVPQLRPSKEEDTDLPEIGTTSKKTENINPELSIKKTTSEVESELPFNMSQEVESELSVKNNPQEEDSALPLKSSKNSLEDIDSLIAVVLSILQLKPNSMVCERGLQTLDVDANLSKFVDVEVIQDRINESEDLNLEVIDENKQNLSKEKPKPEKDLVRQVIGFQINNTIPLTPPLQQEHSSDSIKHFENPKRTEYYQIPKGLNNSNVEPTYTLDKNSLSALWNIPSGNVVAADTSTNTLKVKRRESINIKPFTPEKLSNGLLTNRSSLRSSIHAKDFKSFESPSTSQSSKYLTMGLLKVDSLKTDRRSEKNDIKEIITDSEGIQTDPEDPFQQKTNSFEGVNDSHFIMFTGEFSVPNTPETPQDIYRASSLKRIRSPRLIVDEMAANSHSLLPGILFKSEVETNLEQKKPQFSSKKLAAKFSNYISEDIANTTVISNIEQTLDGVKEPKRRFGRFFSKRRISINSPIKHSVLNDLCSKNLTDIPKNERNPFFDLEYRKSKRFSRRITKDMIGTPISDISDSPKQEFIPQRPPPEQKQYSSTGSSNSPTSETTHHENNNTQIIEKDLNILANVDAHKEERSNPLVDEMVSKTNEKEIFPNEVPPKDSSLKDNSPKEVGKVTANTKSDGVKSSLDTLKASEVIFDNPKVAIESTNNKTHINASTKPFPSTEDGRSLIQTFEDFIDTSFSSIID
jgi:hypothetical protein